MVKEVGQKIGALIASRFSCLVTLTDLCRSCLDSLNILQQQLFKHCSDLVILCYTKVEYMFVKADCFPRSIERINLQRELLKP